MILPISDRWPFRDHQDWTKSKSLESSFLFIFLILFRLIDISKQSYAHCFLRFFFEKLNLSASRTSHILREEFQKSFSEILAESRIQRICDLLETTDLPLRAIAQRTGLSNEYYLNRFFKRKKGIPPGQYRISTPKTADTTEDKNL